MNLLAPLQPFAQPCPRRLAPRQPGQDIATGFELVGVQRIHYWRVYQQASYQSVRIAKGRSQPY
jgi:hypothetical protein